MGGFSAATLALGLGLGLVVPVTSLQLPSIKQMVDDWDARATSTHVSPKPVDSLVAKPGIIDATQLLGGRERRQRIGQLDGVFAAECAVNTSWFGGNDFEAVAQATTSQYNVSSNPRSIDNQNGTFEVDYTEYVGYSCVPGSGGFSKAFAKYNLRGIVGYHGTGVGPLNTSYRASWTIQESDWVFPEDTTSSPYVHRLIAILNDQCPCHGTWKGGAAAARTIRAHQCHGSQVTTDSFPLCQFIAGFETYALYKYTDATRYIQYQSSPVSTDKIAGWTTSPSSRPRSRLPNTDVHDPEDCGFGTLPFQCGVKSGILEDISNNCDGCTRLECAGCAFRYMNTSKDIAVAEDTWSTCCPCAWYVAQIQHQPWMQFDC